MYSLPYFKEHDSAVVLQFMRQHPFAMLTGCADNRPVVTQVPLLTEERDGKLYLQGHIMRQTDHHKAFEKNPNVLAVFTSPNIYVSATWYENPSQGSTWNYISVHARGTLRFLEDDGLIGLMQKLSLHFEDNNLQSATVYDNLPGEYTSRLIKAIVGFEIEVEQLENVFKLSQNRDEKSFHAIIERLQQQGYNGQYIANEMKQRAAQLFSQPAKPV
ncbi:MAG TPA: FMN-binding negative transcriptional regulator [Chitinophagaceae bacterium]|nr:FMN-binding negative transcriptional regulator [Chitinophagaceae bacterium]